MFKFLCSNVGLKLWLKIIQWIAEWCNSFEYFHCPVVKTLDPFSFQFAGEIWRKNVNFVGLSLNNRDQGASPVIKRLNTGIIIKSGVGILNTDDNSIHVYTKIVNEIWWNYDQKLIIWGGINSLTHYRGTAVVCSKRSTIFWMEFNNIHKLALQKPCRTLKHRCRSIFRG